jgi:hypothetical protein
MRPIDLTATLRSLLLKRNPHPIWIWGPPGVGKSGITHQVRAALNWLYVDVRASTVDPVDLRGLPTIAKRDGIEVAYWCPPSFLPTREDWTGLVFLEELAQGNQAVQASMLQLCLDRRIGDYVLPAGARIVAASNNMQDRAGANRIITPLLNRFTHLDLELSNDDWQLWANEHGISPEVRSFLQWKPNLLLQFDPASNVKAFPSPRSWEFVNDHIEGNDIVGSCLQQVVAGTIGEGPAAEFLGYLQIYRELPDLDIVLANPTTTTIPVSKPAVMYALSGAMAEKTKTMDEKGMQALATFYNRKDMPGEFSALTLLNVFQANRVKDNDGKWKTHKRCFGKTPTEPMSKWLAQHRDVLLDPNR